MAKIGIDDVDGEFGKALSNLNSELGKLRSGRASTDLVSGIKVEAYGQQMPIDQLANINVVDATLLSVKPWDKTVVPAVEAAIRKSDIGISPVVDGELIRLPLPPLTEERRKEYVKILKQKVEETRIRVRQIRQEVMNSIEESQEAGDVSEDEAERQKKDLQTKVDNVNLDIEKISEEKENELMTV